MKKMSRYIAPLKGDDSPETHLAYGFDRPLSHYFYIIYEDGMAVGNREGGKGIFFDPPHRSVFADIQGETQNSPSVYELYNIPEEHTMFIVLDLPI